MIIVEVPNELLILPFLRVQPFSDLDHASHPLLQVLREAAFVVFKYQLLGAVAVDDQFSFAMEHVLDEVPRVLYVFGLIIVCQNEMFKDSITVSLIMDESPLVRVMVKGFLIYAKAIAHACYPLAIIRVSIGTSKTSFASILAITPLALILVSIVVAHHPFSMYHSLAYLPHIRTLFIVYLAHLPIQPILLKISFLCVRAFYLSVNTSAMQLRIFE